MADHTRTRSRAYLAVFLVLAVAEAVLTITLLQKSAVLHAQIEQDFKPIDGYTQTIALTKGSPAIVIMKERPFRQDTSWMYVSKDAPLPVTYEPKNLVAIEVDQMASTDRFKLEMRTSGAVSSLFREAEKQGHKLIVSSAYRSSADQRSIYDSSLATYGREYTKTHVANPGESEHATGYAVDINSYSDSCKREAANCTLSQTDAAWLAKNAPTYGFILRYPKDKEPETGVSYEPWHFRFIGEHAVTLTNKSLTLDRFVNSVTTGQYKSITSFY